MAKNINLFNPQYVHTTGSTGNPMIFYLDKRVIDIETANVWRFYNWCGVGLNDKVVILRGDVFPTKEKLKYKLTHFKKRMYLSSYYLDDENIEEIISIFMDYKPRLLSGFPQSIYILAKFMKKFGIYVDFKMSIATSSETLFEYQRELIEKQFNTKIFDYYGLSERVVAAAECEKHNGYHIIPEYGLMELIKDNEWVDEGETGKIIGTSLLNYSMPFIRYEVGDIGIYTNEKCECNRSFRLLKSIEGRLSDIIITSDGKYVSGAAFEHFWKHKIGNFVPEIEHCQIIQESRKNLLINIVSNRELEKNKINLIKNKLSELLGNNIQFDLNYVSKIEYKKWRFTISKINIKF